MHLRSGPQLTDLSCNRLTAVPARAATAADNFSDLSAHAAEQPAIARIVAQGIMGPASPGKFDPDGVVTRGEFASSVQRMFALKPPVNPPLYSDVPAGTPAYQVAAAAGPYLGAHVLCGGCVLTNDFFRIRRSPGVSLRLVLARAPKPDGRGFASPSRLPS